MGKSLSFSKTVVGSYVLDWVVIIVSAGIAAILNNITPYKRPFSLYDQDISFPYVPNEKISTATLVVVALVLPLVVIFAVCLILVPGPSVSSATPKKLIWRRKCWEFYTGWTGLALSCAAAFLITDGTSNPTSDESLFREKVYQRLVSKGKPRANQILKPGMKNLFGRPRPHLLSLCDADYANALNFTAGALAPGNITLRVSQTICRNKDKSLMDDAFRSFPSGHSSFSCAGLVYLSLFLASKLSITIPFLAPHTLARTSRKLSFSPSTQPTYNNAANGSGNNIRSRTPKNPNESTSYASVSGHDDVKIAARDQAASPPLYLLVIAALPSFAAIYIASTRFTDFKHHAFDILFGQFIGITTAWFAFRWYHLPIQQGAGWSWGPRSSKRAFWAGVGVGAYCEAEEEKLGTNGRYESVGGRGIGDSVDLEAGPNVNGQDHEHDGTNGEGSGSHDGLNVR